MDFSRAFLLVLLVVVFLFGAYTKNEILNYSRLVGDWSVYAGHALCYYARRIIYILCVASSMIRYVFACPTSRYPHIAFPSWWRFISSTRSRFWPPPPPPRSSADQNDCKHSGTLNGQQSLNSFVDYKSVVTVLRTRVVCSVPPGKQ